ncbi:MAG: ACP S-malonyltransferase [Alphaproteobacteria bacterium]|nr:ACP S-malonyltransferase [Alphaproteobacteria bacterium]
MKHAFVFPGQGSQAVGMGKDFYDQFSTAKDVFDEVDETLAPLLGHKLSAIIFEGPTETLTQTLYTQSALMATSMAIYRTLEHTLGKPLEAHVSFMAGHSLGEYSALCAAGVLSLKDTSMLLYYRGKAMTECVPGGAMAAIMGLEIDVLEDIVANAECFIANDNGGGQIVISGSKASVTKAMEVAQASGAKRAIALQVSAPFHCPLMANAAEIMKEKIQNVTFHNTKTPIITNISAEPQTQGTVFKQHLVEQICGRVRFRETTHAMAHYGVTHVTEIGAGKVLSNLCKRIQKDLITTSISTVSDIDEFLAIV